MKSWVPPGKIHLKCHSYAVVWHVHIQNLNFQIHGVCWHTYLQYFYAHGDSTGVELCPRRRGRGAFEIAVRKRNILTIELIRIVDAISSSVAPISRGQQRFTTKLVTLWTCFPLEYSLHSDTESLRRDRCAVLAADKVAPPQSRLDPSKY